MMNDAFVQKVLEPKSKPKSLDTNEPCPICEHQYDFVDVIEANEYTEDMDRRPVCTRVNDGGLIEVYYHESMIGGEMWL